MTSFSIIHYIFYFEDDSKSNDLDKTASNLGSIAQERELIWKETHNNFLYYYYTTYFLD